MGGMRCETGDAGARGRGTGDARGRTHERGDARGRAGTRGQRDAETRDRWHATVCFGRCDATGRL